MLLYGGFDMKKKRVRNIIWIIIDALIVLIVAYFVVGYFNFFNISKGKEPVFEGEVTNYKRGIGNVTVHNYKLYKVVEYEIPDQNVSYSMKLWFMDDVK